MAMSLDRRRAAADTDRPSKDNSLLNARHTEDSANLREIQANIISERYGLPLHRAALVAELHFGGGG